jgi:hypothetical protein
LTILRRMTRPLTIRPSMILLSTTIRRRVETTAVLRLAITASPHSDRRASQFCEPCHRAVGAMVVSPALFRPSEAHRKPAARWSLSYVFGLGYASAIGRQQCFQSCGLSGQWSH